jgi:rhomboid protease GluP
MSASPTGPTARPWVTYALIAANVAMFAIELAVGADPIRPTPQSMIELGGDFAPLTLHGEWWRLVSSMFLHYGVGHIAMNMIVLYQARFVEGLYGRAGFAAIYLASGLLGGIASLAHAQNVVSAGASGAVFGVFGAVGAFLVLRRGELDPVFLQQRGRALIAFIAINLIYGMQQASIDLSAHLGGLGAGFLAGAALLVRPRPDARRVTRAIAVAVLAIGATAGGVQVIPKSDKLKLLDDFHDIEPQCVSTYNSHLRELQAKGSSANHADETALADVIDHDVLPPWRSLRSRIEAETEVPARLSRLFGIMRTYLSDRDDAWAAYSAALRGNDPAKLQADLHAYHEREAAAAKDVKDLDDEFARLK